MKKKLVILPIAIATIFTACGSSKPESMSQDVYDLGVKAVEVSESYMDGDITLDEFDDKIESIIKQMDRLPDSDDVSTKVADTSIAVDLSSLNVEILNESILETGQDLGINTSGSSDLREVIDNLKEDLNMK